MGTIRGGTAGPFGLDDDLVALDVVQVAPPIPVPAVPPLVLGALAVVLLGVGALIAKRRT
jgi:hypothetical protein